MEAEKPTEINVPAELELFRARSMGAAEDGQPQPNVQYALKMAYTILNRKGGRRLQHQVRDIARGAKRLRKSLHG